MNKVYKIRSQSMLGTSHSWAVTMRNLLTQFYLLGHDLSLYSTDGDSLIPDELRSFVGKNLGDVDLDFCYTLPRNFRSRFKKTSKVKMAIYNYETNKLPKMWVNDIRHLDYVLPSSQFSREVFLDAGWPEEKCIVVPHGINPEDYLSKDKYKISVNKSFKFLNISIPHYRKNIDILLDAYYSAFSNQDDVCLVLKTSLKDPDRKRYRFEADVKQQIISAQRKYVGKRGGLPALQIIQERLPDMVPLYNSCNVLVSAASSEGFGLPLLEGLAAGNLVISPRCTGQLDFLNDKNSLLTGVIEIPAGEKYQYWVPTKDAITYLPVVEFLSDAMLKAYHNYDSLQESFLDERERIINEFTWENAARKILDLL